MRRLLNIEIQKIYHNRSARILSLIYFILLIPVLLIFRSIFQKTVDGVNLEDFGIFNFPYIWHFSTYFVQFLKIFLAVVIVSLISSEYSNRTLKQNLIDGLSKKEFVASKFIAVLLFAAISTLIVFITTLILGLSFSDFTEPSVIFSDLDYLLAYFIRLTGFFSLCLFLGFLMKRSAFALGMLLVYWIVEKLLVFGILFISQGEVKNISFDGIAQYFPLGSMESLIVEPITRLQAVSSAGQQLGADFSDKLYAVQYDQIALVVVYTAIFVWGAYALLKKRDL